jgi:uncharacterized protein YggE
MAMKTIGILLILACVAVAPASIAAERPELARTVSVSGHGTTPATPDRAEITTGVHTQAETAGAALSANNEAVARVFKALAEHGIVERDRQTRNLQVGPVYEQIVGPTRGGAPRIVGYQVTNQVRVVVRDLAKLGALLDALVRSGANRLDGIRFVVSDPAAAIETARKTAIEDAKRRAALYVEATGGRLGRVLQISEGAIHLPRPEFLQAAAARSFSAEVPIAPGENEISANVSVVFAIE